jgi:hypothetical protein
MGIPCSRAASVGSPKQPSGITRHEISAAVKIPGRFIACASVTMRGLRCKPFTMTITKGILMQITTWSSFGGIPPHGPLAGVLRRWPYAPKCPPILSLDPLYSRHNQDENDTRAMGRFVMRAYVTPCSKNANGLRYLRSSLGGRSSARRYSMEMAAPRKRAQSQGQECGPAEACEVSRRPLGR